MKSLLITMFGVFMAYTSAQAACPNNVTSLSVGVGQAAKHLTIVDTATCVAIAGVTFSPVPAHVNIVADPAGGYLVTGIDATPGFPGFEAVTFSKPQYTSVIVNFTSSLPLLGTLGATNP